MDNNLLLGLLWSWSGLALSTIDAVNFKVILKILSNKKRRSSFQISEKKRNPIEDIFSSVPGHRGREGGEENIVPGDVARQLNQLRSYWHGCRIFPLGFSFRTLREPSGSTG